MIINIILFSLIIFSLGALALVVYRKMPSLIELSEEEMAILKRKKNLLAKIKGVDYKQGWLDFIIYLEKFLWKVKIVFIKIENFLGRCIKGLRMRSQIMTQKSREWIRQRELKRNRSKRDEVDKEQDEIPIKINQNEEAPVSETEEEIEAEEDLPLSELKKPIKEEQKWIDLIVENPKNITAYKFLGLLYWRQHNYADARASLEMAVKLGSRDKKLLEVLEELKRMNIKAEE